MHAGNIFLGMPSARPGENSRCNAYYPLMADREPLDAPRRNAEQTAFLNILRTADVLESEVAALLRPMGLSATQYNVLRILRAAGKEGLPSGQIAARMLTHDPDVTRLLDRLESRGLIARRRGWSDRRVVAAAITPEGRKLLEKLDRPILQLHRNQLGQLGREKLRELGELLRLARERTG